HFSAFQLSDGSSPSDAYLPSLQGWQVSAFTGAASFRYPLELPAGPNGLAPDVTLHYRSDATDGRHGMRPKHQASWVGKGWSLETGSVALNKVHVSGSTTVRYYTLTFNGRTFDLVRDAALAPNPDRTNPAHWSWRPTTESFLKVKVEPNGVSWDGANGGPGRGGFDWGNPYPRYTWTIWATNGTRYEFTEDLWWGWNYCTGAGSGDFAYMEPYRWLLSKVTDTHGNTINYAYGRSAQAHPETCFHVRGTTDADAWPTTITWAGGRYQAEFISYNRSNDTAYETPAYQYGQAVHKTRYLDTINIKSKQDQRWELVRQYQLGYDYSLSSDARKDLGNGAAGPETAYPKLTLKHVQRVGNDSSITLPATEFGYQTTDGTAYHANGGWNRLREMDNNQGGVQRFSYANIAVALGNNGNFTNRHRVTAQTQHDGRGNSATWTYRYGTPQINSLGTSLGDDVSPQSYPNSAAVYYNHYRDEAHDERAWLAHPRWQEFRGHGYVTAVDPSGTQTERWFYQGAADCTPPPSARGSHAAITGDPCFQRMRDRAFLTGREYRTRILGASSIGSPALAETTRQFGVAFYGYGYPGQELSGLWRAFPYEAETTETAIERDTGAPTSTTTKYYYEAGAQYNQVQYGNLTTVEEYDQTGARVRRTEHAYTGTDTDSAYIVDRPWSTVIRDSQDRLLAVTHFFYTGYRLNDPARLAAPGDLVRETHYSDVPLQTSSVGVRLHGTDTTYGYDASGNRTTVATYPQAGTRLVNSRGGWAISAPGQGSAARTT
ncbi:MAG: hypothetical protein MI924_28200, partial [Chloroflexales bacterium]|nr:hypothetical protein [Chloroflexales bacterium]